MTAGTFFAKFAGKIVKIIGLVLLIASFACPFAITKSGNGRSNESESKDDYLMFHNYMCFNKLDKDDSSEEYIEYTSVAQMIFTEETKKAPISIVDLVAMALVSLAALGFFLIEFVPAFRKIKMFDKSARFYYKVILVLGTAIAATSFQAIYVKGPVGFFTLYGIATLIGLLCLLAGENFESMVQKIKAFAAGDKKSAAAYVALLATPIVFIAAFIGAGLVGGWFFAARFFIIPGAVAGCLFAFIASEALKKVSNK